MQRVRRSGIILLVVIGVLGVLALLGVAFVTMARLDRQASQQRLHATRALLLARSGLEDAQARLDAGQDPEASASRYRGEDWDASGTLNAFEPGSELYRPGILDTDACPVGLALRPSFFRADPASPGADGRPAPFRILVDGRTRGLSGRLSSDLYALKISSGGFYLNGGDPSVHSNPTGTTDYNLVLRRMLGTLAEAVDREDGVAGNGPVAQADGFSLIDARPSAGWQDWRQLRDQALGGSQAKLDALKPYLTLYAWVDRKVIAPNVTAAMAAKSYLSWADIKLDRALSQPGSRAPDFERIGGKVVGRAPVGLAWARTRRPALIALLAGLKGLFLDESTAGSLQAIMGHVDDAVGTLQAVEILNTWSPADDCHLAASRILSLTSDLGTWEQWNAFCDAIPFTGTTDLAQAKRDLLKANFNPNSDLNKFSPNASLWRSVDKSDLLAYSTEFGLMGGIDAQEVESVGRVLDAGGHLLAERAVTAAIAPACLVRLTTQGEFVCGDLGSLDLAGDELNPRLPGAAPFLSHSTGLASAKTWGYALGGVGDPGLALQTYPEPCVKPGAALEIHPARYDGSVQLATVETAQDEWYGVPVQSAGPPPDQNMMMLARYTAGLDLDVADATQPPTNNPLADKNQTDVLQVTTAELGLSLWDSTKPNTLYPDGCYSEKDRAPSYFDKGNANGYHGVISFWIKANHKPPVFWGRGHPFLKWSNFSPLPFAQYTGTDQFFYLGDCTLVAMPSLACFFEIGYGPYPLPATGDDPNMEHLFSADTGLTRNAWQLLTTYYDFRAPTEDDTYAILLDAGLGVNHGANRHYVSMGTFGSNNPSWASDITNDDQYGPHRLILGCGRPLRESGELGVTGSGADATFDELAVYDFGGSLPPAYLRVPTALASPVTLASNRYKDGRYYKESDYTGPGNGANRAAEYFSAPVRLGPSCRIRSLAWTQVVPKGLRAPADPGPDGRILLELVDVSGGSYLPDQVGKPIAVSFQASEGSPVQRTVKTAFRFHAVFQPNLDAALLPDTPILDPLALDDLTVVFDPLGRRRILAWEPR